MAHPSQTAKCTVIGARYTGKPRVTYDEATGALSHCLPPVHGHCAVIQRLLLTPVPESRSYTWTEKIGVFMPGAVSKAGQVNPVTGAMQ
jgi:hypothetical protein